MGERLYSFGVLLRCAKCKKTDTLYRDAFGAFCDNCGPSYRVEKVPVSDAAKSALQGQEARDA